MTYKFEEMINRIKAVKKEKKITNAMLAELSGVPYGTLNKILGMETKEPSINAIIKIAVALGVSTNYIINGAPKITDNSSESEMQHIKKYRALDEHGKTVINNLLEEEYKRVVRPKVSLESISPQKDNMISISYYAIGASAGNGIWLDDNIECVSIQIPFTEESRRADFAISVRGNSMEPKYYNGDLLLVRKQPSINVGEIGIFVLNEQGYVKKQGENGLLSVNGNYEDISVHEYDRIDCKGKVVGCIPAQQTKQYLPQ